MNQVSLSPDPETGMESGRGRKAAGSSAPPCEEAALYRKRKSVLEVCFHFLGMLLSQLVLFCLSQATAVGLFSSLQSMCSPWGVFSCKEDSGNSKGEMQGCKASEVAA